MPISTLCDAEKSTNSTNNLHKIANISIILKLNKAHQRNNNNLISQREHCIMG